ncbi:hypothetical protein PWT90_05148 [Aphanocladium album]|nr:hypothetical protein PWT90_05148 [Aphanocladium album]
MSSSAAPVTDPERQPLLPSSANAQDTQDGEPIVQQRPWWKRKRTILKGCGLVFLIDLGISGLLTLYLLLTRGHHDKVLRYPGETVNWTPCGDLKGRPLECGTITVPMDHFNASRSGNQTFTVPMTRLRGSSEAKQNILFNPGGPGGSGIDFLKRVGVDMQKALGDEFHLIGFDPRGIGASRPQAVCFPDAKARRTHQPQFDGVDEHDIEHYSEVGAWTQACMDHVGEHAGYINTPQTAADMNSILDALGQDGLYYIGYSYGTALGATYATLFPNRTERVVIDGVLDNFIWYNNLTTEEFSQDDDTIFAGIFDECVKDGDACKLSSFGQTGKDIQNNVTSFLSQLKDNGPMPVYVNSTIFGTVSYDSLYRGIFMSMYNSKKWYSLADSLAQLMSGNGTAALLAYPDHDLRDDGNDAMNEHFLFVMANDRPAGHPTWPDDRYEVLRIASGAQKYMPWMTGNVASLLYLAQWRVPKTHAFKPRRGVDTRHPVLVMSSTYDPVCPLASAKRARATFNGAKLIEVKGIGHCALSQPSRCAARLLRAYMVNGTMPEEDHTLCERDDSEPYFNDPEKKAEAVSVLGMDEDAELMAAWRSLADAIPPPRFAGMGF